LCEVVFFFCERASMSLFPFYSATHLIQHDPGICDFAAVVDLEVTATDVVYYGTWCMMDSKPRWSATKSSLVAVGSVFCRLVTRGGSQNS
jgi:hypothetical protein